MKIKTNELTGAALDWAVAKCWYGEDYDMSIPLFDDGLIFAPSTNWAHGGPIIEREKMTIEYGYGLKSDQYLVSTCKSGYPYMFKRHNGDGPTPLIAAMRCYVASKLGDTVEVPDELSAA